MKEQKLNILKEIVSKCEKCPLHAGAKQPVFGNGNHDADIMIVGEAPGKVENEHGVPFIGPAGKYLNAMLEMSNIERESIYITNIVKCIMPDNRAPVSSEVRMCIDYLIEEINIVSPKVILCAGLSSFKKIVTIPSSMTARYIRNIQHKIPFKYKFSDNLPVLYMFHPSYIMQIERSRGAKYKSIEMAAALEDIDLTKRITSESQKATETQSLL